MRKRIILHIGFPKTGTTAIQSFCFLNAEALGRAGVHYPDLSLVEGDERPMASHKALLTALMADPPARLAPLKDEAVRRSTATFDAFRDAPQGTLVLSHETLSQRDDLDFPRLRAWAGDLPVTVVAFVRTFDEWLESLYAQNLRGDRMVGKRFADTRLGRLEAMRFIHPLRAIRAGLPDARIKLLSFDRVRDRGLVERFLRLCGVADPALLDRAAARPPVNASRPATDVMFGAYLSAALDDPDLTQAVVAALARARKEGAPLPPEGPRLRFLPPAMRQAARDLYRRDLPILHREFGLKATDPGPLGPDGPGETHSLSRERFDALMAAAAPFLPERVRAAPPTLYDRAMVRFG